MSNEYRHFRVERDDRGVVTVTLDVAAYPVNIFSNEVIAELTLIVTEFEHVIPKLIVFRSGKPSGFLAGADVRHIQRIATADEARAALDAGKALFDRVENLSCPTIAVIHGMCLGGGLEFALACRHRLVRDDAGAKLGLPETQLGLIPGWGGTQRLPKVVGLRKALRMILDGSRLSASEALDAGLVDMAFSPKDFDALAAEFISDRLASKKLPRTHHSVSSALMDGTWVGHRLVLRAARHAIASRADHYPALEAAIDALESGLAGREAGMIAENNAFVKLLFTDTARRLIDLFLLRERAGRSATWVAVPDQTPAIRRIAVVGGGIMGAGIAQLAAINGMDVTIKELNCDLAVAGKVRVAQLIDDAVRKGIIDQTQADECLRNVAATSDWKPLENADLAIEAVVEREGVKNEIFAELSQRLAPAAILATNTSSLTVARVTAPVANPRRAAGLHFFNPVHRMQLVEVVRGPETDSRTVAVLVDLVRRLGKTPVVVADGPGFLVNRVLFPYLDEAVRMLAEGFSIETIDRAAVSFGMPMGPLELLDQVGLDIAADVARSLGVYHGDNGPTPIRLSEMVDDGRLGKKSGNGFYAYRDGRRGKATDAATASLRAMDDQHHSRVGPTGVTSIQQRLMYPMINEAARCLEAGVADAPWVIDLAMVLGTGFPPFRGGPLRLVDTWGVGLVVNELEHLQRSEGKRFEPCPMLQEMNHDGRRFYPVAESGKPLPQLASAAGR